MRKIVILSFALILIASIYYFSQDKTALYIVNNSDRYTFTKTNHIKSIGNIEYIYDDNGYKIAKKVDFHVKERYVWLGEGQLKAVLDDKGNVLREYIYENKYSILPKGMTINGERYGFIYNPMKSLRLVVKEKQIVKIIDYDHKGLILQDTNKELKVDFGYAGGIWDEDSRLLFYTQGVYEPIKSQWITKVKDIDIIENLKQLNATKEDEVYKCNATLDVYYHAYLCTSNQCGGLYATDYLNYFNGNGAMIDNSYYFNHNYCKSLDLSDEYDKKLFSSCVKENIKPKNNLVFDAFRHNCHHAMDEIIEQCKQTSLKGKS
ncbi:hypothetical protein [Arcobacter sp. FWKO B]|uniref:hypothetical protein n=1 Tax=Arcobacter sp. FWKO B TaxID=2593672 RepID=UPI0018A3DBB0|nr:hypothetical protein [Arcobacter sp. FWKO B]QOG12436.1 hypothetical protein FWKOB_06860 [Arcobacter sp. FWKO B]